tara:strand:- start:1039 stop:1809 length:771 start_codon:yes stop_codon:yes gene_type:complete
MEDQKYTNIDYEDARVITNTKLDKIEPNTMSHCIMVKRKYKSSYNDYIREQNGNDVQYTDTIIMDIEDLSMGDLAKIRRRFKYSDMIYTVDGSFRHQINMMEMEKGCQPILHHTMPIYYAPSVRRVFEHSTTNDDVLVTIHIDGIYSKPVRPVNIITDKTYPWFTSLLDRQLEDQLRAQGMQWPEFEHLEYSMEINGITYILLYEEEWTFYVRKSDVDIANCDHKYGIDIFSGQIIDVRWKEGHKPSNWTDIQSDT